VTAQTKKKEGKNTPLNPQHLPSGNAWGEAPQDKRKGERGRGGGKGERKAEGGAPSGRGIMRVSATQWGSKRRNGWATESRGELRLICGNKNLAAGKMGKDGITNTIFDKEKEGKRERGYKNDEEKKGGKTIEGGEKRTTHGHMAACAELGQKRAGEKTSSVGGTRGAGGREGGREKGGERGKARHVKSKVPSGGEGGEKKKEEGKKMRNGRGRIRWKRYVVQCTKVRHKEYRSGYDERDVKWGVSVT